MNPDEQQKLERLIHQTLREIPARRAPRSLEQRVLAEIERRAALPWWRLGFAHWPLAARVAFVIACGGVAKFALTAAVWAYAGIDAIHFQSLFATPLAWLDTAQAVGRALGDFVSLTLRSVPTVWWYGAAAVVGALYMTLFGLGAAAYRALYASR